MSSARVLLIGSELTASASLLQALEAGGLEVLCVRTAAEALECAAELQAEVVLVDRHAGGDELLDSQGPASPALILTDAFGSIEEAVDAMRRGASDYLAMPAAAEQIQLVVHRALTQRRLVDENQRLRDVVAERRSLGGLVTRDPRLQAVLETIESVADTCVSVLIAGESGTGKTLLASALHESSERAAGPFVEVNCGALTPSLLESELFGHARGAFTGAVRDNPGKFEAADGGTLFLDEIGAASADLQVKLLRVLEDRRVTRVGESEPRNVDVRLVAATNVDLQEEVTAGRFREDLYYRLNVLALQLPPLRERPADVALLAARFLTQFTELHGRDVQGLEPAALSALCAHSWPGNVRELRHCMERAVLLSQSQRVLATELGLPASGERSGQAEPGSESTYDLREELAAAEREIIRRALMACEGSRVRAAELLGINRATLLSSARPRRVRARAWRAACARIRSVVAITSLYWSRVAAICARRRSSEMSSGRISRAARKSWWARS